MIWSGESNPQHLTQQASAQPTELILPQLSLLQAQWIWHST